MSRLTDSQLERKLRPDTTPEPPAWLLDELRRQIPAEIQAPAPERFDDGDKPGTLLPFRRPLPRFVWLAAASVTMLLGGGTLSYLALRHGVGEEMPEPASAAALRENDENDQSPAETRGGSAEATQSRDLRALGYVGAEQAPGPATAPTSPSRFPPEAVQSQRAAPQVRVPSGMRLQRQAVGEQRPTASEPGRTTDARHGVPTGMLAAPSAANEARAGRADAAGAAPPAEPELLEARRFRLEAQTDEERSAAAGVESDAVGGAEQGELAGAFAVETAPPPKPAPPAAAVAPAPEAPAAKVAESQSAVAREAERRQAPRPAAPAPAVPPSAPQRPVAGVQAAPPPPPASAQTPASHTAALRDGAQRLGFVGSEEARLSTFALDVDRGSYNEVQRYLGKGRMPPAEAVRVEELVNAFDYGDRPPAEGPVALVVEGAPDPWAPTPGNRYVLVRFTVVAREGGLPPGARAEVEVDPRSVVRWRRVGAATSSGGAAAALSVPPLRADTSAGEGEAHSVSAVYALELKPGVPENGTVAMLRLRWRTAAGGQLQQVERPLRRGELASRWETAGRGFRLATVVGRFAELLRGAPAGERAGAAAAQLGDLRKRAEAVGGDAQVKELVRWIDKARDADR